MPDVVLFVEDFAHRAFLEALLKRLAGEFGVDIHLDWRNARRGHGAVVRELKQFLRDLQQDRHGFPDLLVVATDANCKGLNGRAKEIADVVEGFQVPVICAVPDPHIERWLLLDSAAFKTVLARGCRAPDRKCERDRDKAALIDAIVEAGVTPSLGGIEFAADLVNEMDLVRAARSDPSFRRFFEAIQQAFAGWSA